MIQKINAQKLKPLNRVSPSQYYSAISCPYKLVLANSFEYRMLLPLNANAYFGSILHKMIELISKGIISNDETFTENWIRLISEKEAELRGKGLATITPLKYYVSEFALKKKQIKNILQKKQGKANTSQKLSSTRFYPEKRLENSNKTVSGVADLVIENDFGTTILDFKTGKIYSDAIDEGDVTEQVLKKEYEIQLKLYAHLYFLMTGRYPNALFIMTLSDDFIEVKFETLECGEIYAEALNFLNTTNSFIASNNIEAMANPSVQNCKYCSYRPACSLYSKWLTTNFEAVNDLFGVIEKVNLFNNGSLGLQLVTLDKRVLVNGLSIEQQKDFESFIGRNVVLYNLKKTKQSLNATANNLTVVYE